MTAQSDVLDRDENGRWNFALNGANSGVVCLDGGNTKTRGNFENTPSVMPFQVSSGNLSMDNLLFFSDDVLTAKGDLSSLSEVAVPVGYQQLFGDWTKTNDFDPGTTPTEIHLDPLGRFSASYRGGSCTQDGAYGWDRGNFISVAAVNHCDGSSGGNEVSLQTPQHAFVDDLLVFYAGPYRRSGSSGPRVFIFDGGPSIRVRGEFDGTLKKGVPLTVRLRFDNVDSQGPKAIGTLTVGITSGPGAKSHVLAQRTFSAQVVSGTPYTDSITFTPDVGGDSASLDWTLADQPGEPGSPTVRYTARIEP